jgi:hypothetical protein
MVHPQDQQRPQSILTPLRQLHAKAEAIIPTDLVKFSLPQKNEGFWSAVTERSGNTALVAVIVK